MRQSITTTLFAVLLSMVGINAFGHDIEVKNADGVTIYYKWINNNKLEVSYRGSDYSSYSNNSNKYTGNVVIPESVNINGNTYPVTSIGEFAFQNCYGLTSVTIPNSVTSIGESTFRRCSGLTSVTIPNSVSSIGHNAFDGCSGLTSVTIPNGVSSIGYNAFFGTAWYNNQPDGLVYAGKVVYKYKGEMPANTHITIKNGTQGIAISAFDGCSGLTSVTIPNSVTSIGVHAFDGTAWYNNQPNGLVYAGKVAYDYKGEMPANTKITLKDGTLVIAENAFYNCTGLISVTIPNSVTSIGDWAFNGCIGLTSVTIPNSVTFIGRSAFNGCSGMASVFIPSSVTSIGGNAFYGCSALTSIKVESDNQTYDSRYNCNAIIEKSTNTLIAGCKNTIIPNSVTSIGDWVFNGCIGLTSVTIPNSVTSIGRSAFNGCSGLTSITIPNSVTSIGDYAFAYCSGLTSITIPNSITSIGKDAFSSCSGLKTIYSELKTPIQIAYSEYNKYAEDYIYLYPFSDDNFSNTILYVPKDTKSTYLATAGWNKFTNIFEVGEVGSIFEVDGIYYVIGQDNTVSVISGKTKYSGDVVIPSQVTCLGATYSVNSIEEEVFIGCSGLTSVTIPNSVTSIGFGAFIGCTSLVSVTIPSSMTFIDRATFEGCSSLASVTIPNSVRHIGGSAFSGTAWLKNQPDGLIYAGKLAYYYKGNMPDNTHITLKNGTLGINLNAFKDCSGLASITIPNSVTSIGQNAFSGCTGLTSIAIPNSVTSIGWSAFQGCSSLSTVVSEIEDPFAIGNSEFSGIASNATLIVPKGKKSIYQSTAGWNQFANIAESSGKCGANVYYSYNAETHTLTISGEGEMWGWQLMEIDDRPWRSFYKNIRSIVINSGVTSIGNWAFTNFESLTSVTIPSSVATIYDCAFLGCSGLTSVTIPNGVIMIEDDDWGGAFGNCTGLTSIIIPNSVTSLGGDTFRGCSNLTSIKVESGNQKYDSRDNCNAIIEKSSNTLISGCKNTIIPNSVTSIGYKAFRDCRGLTSITIPNSVTSIGSSAFSGCSGLTSVTIPNSVTSICGAAFYGCSGLTSVNIPNSVTSIGSSAFDGTAWYNNQPDGLVYAGKVAYKYKGNMPENTSITIKDGTLGIAGSAFSYCSSLTSVTIPNSVTSIGNYAFSGCRGLTKIISEIENPFSIVDNVFSCYDKDIYASATLVVPPGKKSIYQNTDGWKQFSNIVEAELIGYEFESGGIRYKIGENNTVSVSRANYSGDLVIPSSVVYHGKTYSVTSIGNNAFSGCRGLTSVTIPNSVTSIGGSAFFGCDYLTSVTIPNSVTTIGDMAFQECGLTSITIPNSVTRIGFEVFKLCSLTSVTIPNSVTSIGGDAFSECSGLTSVTIPSSVTSIAYTAFSDCRGLTSIKVESGNEKYDSRNNCNAIIESASNTLITGCKNSTIPNGVTSIGRSAFEGCSGLTSVTIPNSVTSIGNYAFSYSSSLTSVTIPNSVTSIGSSAFYGCSGLTKIISEIENPFSISDNAFYCYGKDIYASATLVVPPGKKSAYQSKAGWNKFQNIEESVGVTVTAISYSIVYGDALPIYGYISTGAALSGTPSISCSATAASPVGTYTITISKGSVTNKYDSYVNGTLTINKAPLTVTAKNYTIKQGQALPTFEATYSGLKNSETSSVLTTQPSFSCSATSASEPGTYDIIVSGAAAQNYDISYEKGTLTIINADPVAVTANSYTITYGDALPTYGYTSIGAALSGTPSISCSATATSPAGTYPITISKGSVTNNNDIYVNGTLTINKAPLTITAKNYIIKQGESLPTFEATYSGFKNSETSSVLTTQPSFNCSATSGSALGTYDIIVSGAAAQNYNFIYVKGTLTITDTDPVAVTANSYTITYGDALPTYEYTSIGAALKGTPSVSCSATATSPAGIYPITISKGSVTNYNDIYVNGTLTISKAPLTITAKNYIIKQGESLPTFEANYSGFKNSETSSVLTTLPSFSCSATSVSEPGTYDIIVSGAAAQNYSMSYVKGTLTITADDTPILLGDANNDGVVDAADIVELVNAKAGHPSASFNLNNADANADGNFTEADITATADIIMKR